MIEIYSKETLMANKTKRPANRIGKEQFKQPKGSEGSARSIGNEPEAWNIQDLKIEPIKKDGKNVNPRLM
jgi:hypothetical protein